ncbi:MAG TPA: TonB-dependent receptor [Candidatus Polarisedimenticolia bacterium]|nr:TonB-dependent receptor [Candidatus Polarisedimenticolia bacterium]
MRQGKARFRAASLTRRALILLVCLGGSSILSGLRAATTCEIRGTVVDGDSRPLPGVVLVLRNDTLASPERGTVTDAGGKFRFALLTPGPGYRLRASLAGFSTIEFRDIELSAGEVHAADIVLRPEAELRETIRVQAQGDVVDTERPTTSTVFSSELIAGLPVLGRDYQDILSLAPGVTDVNDTGNPNIHGARDTDMVTLVDGVSTTDPFTGYYGQQLNIESIQEIEIITSGASAEFSRAQGGFANVVTKSGGNEFQATFKMFVRSHRLDGDGAGIDPPDVQGGIGEAKGFRDLRFTDLYPFLSLSGAIRKDRLWYYLASEYIQQENPVNAVTQAFVIPTRGYRQFVKATAQLAASHKLVFSLSLDHTRDDNLGIDSLVNTESGYSFERGGPTYTLKGESIFGPQTLLESTVSWFDNRFARTPTLDPDTNRNGILYVDQFPELGGNQNGLLEVSELDSGEDYDRDAAYDLWEDFNHDTLLEREEDLDGDGRLTDAVACEGKSHEDVNCNGRIDRETDANLNGKADPEEDTGLGTFCQAWNCPEKIVPGTAGNGRFDSEDRNGNGLLDVVGDSGYTPYPFWNDRNHNGIHEYGEYQAPLPPDRGYLIDVEGRQSGPNPYEYADHRTRLTWREDLSVYVPEFFGTHDFKLGAVYEREGFDRDTWLRPSSQIQGRSFGSGGLARETLLTAFMGVPIFVNNTAAGSNLGLYLQDTYKPLPNLTFGLGLRFDREDLTSFGFTSFDPHKERRIYSNLMALTGVDSDLFDSISPKGIEVDPLYASDAQAALQLSTLLTTLRSLAPRRMTRHNADIEVFAPGLGPVIGRSGSLASLLQLGVRPRTPEDIRIQNNNLAPRLSVTWDPRSDGKSKLFASWNRYYDKLFLNTMVLEEGPDEFTRVYTFDPDGLTILGVPNGQVGRSVSLSPPTAFQIDRRLRTPFSDEVTAGYQRELAPEITFSVTYVRRDYRDQLQDIDLNHHAVRDPETGRYLDRNGTVCGTATCALDGLPDLYVENFFLNRVFRLGNYNQQTYRGWELEIARRLSRKWQMNANYTYSKSWGNAESFLSDVGDDPTLAEFEPGFLSYDQRHVIKLSAKTNLPRDWQLGGIATWASGLPYSMVQLRDASDDVGYVQQRLLYGSIGPKGLESEPRNNHRNHATYDFNARLQKSFVMGSAAASGFFEVFNILNSDSLRVFEIQQRQGIAGRDIRKIIGERRFGRRFEFGVQLDF